MRKTSEEKVSGKCSIFHVLPDFGKSFTLTVVTSPFYTSTWLVWLPFSLKLSISKQTFSKTDQKICRSSHENYNPLVQRKLLFRKFSNKFRKLISFGSWGKKLFTGVNISALYVLRRKIWRIFFKLRFSYKKRKV